MSQAWEVTVDDIQIVARKHGVILEIKQLDELMSNLDMGIIEDVVLHYDTMEEQTNASFACIEEQMIEGKLFITEPKLFPFP